MSIVKWLDGLAEKSKVIRALSKFQNSILYPIMMAAITVISGTHGREIYLPCIWFITAWIVLSGLFVKDMKVFLPPAFIAFYAVGLDVSADHYKQFSGDPTFSLESLPHFVACVAIIFAVIAFRLYVNGVLKTVFTKRGLFFWGIVIFSVSMLLNGILSKSWEPFDIICGLTVCLALFVFYCIFLAGLADSHDLAAYACKTLVVATYVVVLQVLIMGYRHYINGTINIIAEDVVYFNRGALSLAWSPAVTIQSALIAMGIPAAMYLARSRKHSWLSVLSAVIFMCACVYTRTRCATLFGVIALIIGLAIICVGGKNKVKNRIYTAVFAALCVGGVIAYMSIHSATFGETIAKMLDFMRLSALNEEDVTLASVFDARWIIWGKGLRDFVSAPIFGTGFMESAFVETTYDNFFRNMYHNVFVEVLGSTGIVGTLAFLIHMKHFLEVILRRFSIDKLLLLSVPLIIIGMSLLDNFFFYPNFQIIYAIFIAVAELELEKARRERINNIKTPQKGKKPRVVFAFVEAGKGHIVPTQSVFSAFCKKYGDRAEIIKSSFFTETQNEDMQRSEKLFASAVRGMSKTSIMSVLCKTGNTIAGDSFAMEVLLSMTASGRKTAPLAVKHVSELDADVIYTAHWSIPYYVNQLEEKRPYTICFCPDVYSNGAFNTDCNEFLISSDVGYRRAVSLRMYAGGNVTQVPFPMREEIMSARGEKGKIRAREALGIADGEFVVALSDGGYGVARLEKTVNALMRSKTPITVIALCGTNHELYLRLCERVKGDTGNVKLIPVDFTNEIVKYIAAADIYAGKSGANSIAEPAALGVPIIVTRCATYIERGIKDYYVKKLHGAEYVPNAIMAAKRIIYFAEHREKLAKYKENLLGKNAPAYDATATADLIWQRACEMCGISE